jgi:hypothetical protein
VTIFSDALRNLMALPGARYLCCAEQGTGAIIAERGIRVVDPEEVVAWLEGVGLLLARGPDADELDDLMVTSGRHYHVLRQIAADGWPPIVVYLCLDRARSNLALARRELAVLNLARNGVPALESGDRAAPDRAAAPGHAPVPPAAAPPAPRSSTERRPTSAQVEDSTPPSGRATRAPSSGRSGPSPPGSVPKSRPKPSPRSKASARARPSPTPRKPTPPGPGDGGAGDGGGGEGSKGDGAKGADGERGGSAPAGPADGPPLPRRVPTPPPPPLPRPAEVGPDAGVGRPAPGGRGWAHDVGTMRRLLSALRCLK